MQLMNMMTKQPYPMKKIGPYTLFSGELVIDKPEQSVNWPSKSKVYEAVLLGAPKIEVLEASEDGRKLLNNCYLEILIDGEPTSSVLALMGDNKTIMMGEERKSWFGAVDDGNVKGVFLSNGAVVQAIVRCPQKSDSIPRIRITIEAELHEASADGREEAVTPAPPAVDLSAKTAKEIGETIQKAEYEDWSMAMTADLIRHSVPCTTDLCLRLNSGRPLECSCGRGIRK